jgi:hypothetical protein
MLDVEVVINVVHRSEHDRGATAVSEVAEEGTFTDIRRLANLAASRAEAALGSRPTQVESDSS